MSPPQVRVLLNPKAGAGAAARRLPQVRDALRRFELSHDVVETAAAGDATRLAAEARDDGVEVLAVVGGDGTLNEVSQAYLDAEGRALGGPELAVIPAGTGGDYKRTLGLSGNLDEAVARIRHGSTHEHDSGFLRLTGHDRAPVTRTFINITSFGVGGVTDKLVNETPKWLGGKASFFIGTTRALLSYRNVEVRIRLDGALFHEGPIFNVAIAIGRFFGGGMKIAPHADPEDGLFDVVVLGDLAKHEALALSNKIYVGGHLGQPKVSTSRARTLEAEPIDPWATCLIDMDGETPGQLPLRASVVPKAIRVRY